LDIIKKVIHKEHNVHDLLYGETEN